MTAVCDGWDGRTQPATHAVARLLPLLLSILFTLPSKRRFDRSCSQTHREQRSGEIRFSTSTFPTHHGALVFVLRSSSSSSTLKTAHSESSDEPGNCRCFCQQSFFRVFRPKIACQAPKPSKCLKQKEIDLACQLPSIRYTRYIDQKTSKPRRAIATCRG